MPDREFDLRHALLPVLLLLVSLPPISAAEIAPGLRYEQRSAPGPLSIHWLEVDPQRVSLRLKYAGEEGLRRETVSALALREGAIAAVNGGFFTMGGPLDGMPTGILKVGERWISDSALPRGVIGWRLDGRDVLIGRLRVFWSLTLGTRRFAVDRINTVRRASSAIVYTDGFRSSTGTDPGGHDVVVSDGRVTGILTEGDAPIPERGFVYSAGPIRKGQLAEVRPGMRARLNARFEPGLQARPSPAARWPDMDFILGGTPVLVSQGRVLTDFREERIQDSFVNGRHPRTAVGIRSDGHWILLVVDGRQEQTSIGMTLPELAEYMVSLGCVRALNLDGGGSSTLFVDGRTRNSPSDPFGERPVSDAILLFPLH
jgi:hypothetical protein